jgi:hypothetical protein
VIVGIEGAARSDGYSATDPYGSHKSGKLAAGENVGFIADGQTAARTRFDDDFSVQAHPPAKLHGTAGVVGLINQNPVADENMLAEMQIVVTYGGARRYVTAPMHVGQDYPGSVGRTREACDAHGDSTDAGKAGKAHPKSRPYLAPFCVALYQKVILCC